MDQVKIENRILNTSVNQLIESMSNLIDVIRDMDIDINRMQNQIKALEKENKNT